MNKIFKVVYNKATGRYEVVSELAKAEGKASSSTLQNKSIFSKQVSRLTVLSLCLASVGFAAAADNSYINVNGNNAGKNEAFFQKMGENGATPVNLSLDYEGKAPAGPRNNKNVAGVVNDNKTVSGAVGDRSIASGVYANALSTDSIAIGTGANVNNYWGSQWKEAVAGIAIGKHAQVEGSEGAIAFGAGSTILRNLTYNVGSANAIAIGNGSKITAASGAIAIGNNANITNVSTGTGNGATNAVAIGNSATVERENSIALGNSATTNRENSIAMGTSARANRENSIAMGTSARANRENSIALGNSTTANRENSVAIGTNVTVERENSVVIGQNASATMERVVAIGAFAKADGDRTVAIGPEATAGASKSIVIGGLGDDTTDNKAQSDKGADQAIVIGNGAQAKAAASYSITLGNSAKTEATTGISIGDRAKVASGADSGIALGRNAVANKSGDIAIGQSSSTSDKHTVSGLAIGNTTLPTGVAATDGGTVSFGSGTIKRQIQNVGAGEISDTSSDVVTGSQLYHVIKAADEIAKTEYKFTVGNSNVRVMGNKNLSATNNTSNTLNFAAADGLDVEGANGTVTYKLNADSKKAISDAKAAAKTVTDKLSEINQSVQDAKAAATKAATSATDAGKAKEAAETAKAGAETAKDAAVTAQGKAEEAKAGAETAKDAAVTAQGKAEEAKAGAETAKDAAVTAQGKAEEAKAGAETAKDAAVTAQGKAEEARDEAVAAKAKVAGAVQKIESSGLIGKDGKVSFAADNTGNRDSARAVGIDSTALGYGSEAKGNDSTVIGNHAFASGTGSVALGNGSVASEDYTVSVGSAGNERRITNVQSPRHATDAANKAYVDSIRDEWKSADKKLRGGVAGATAIANLPQANGSSNSMLSLAVGNYRGQNAFAIGYSKVSDNNRVTLKISGSASTAGDYNVGAGIGFQW